MTLGVLFAGVSTVVALLALYRSNESFWRDHAPIIRAVPKFAGEGEQRRRQTRCVVLKNIGRGPGMSVALVDSAARVLANVDVVEPLGSGPKESERLGRVELPISEDLADGHKFRLFYQDVRGSWHVTEVFASSCGLTTRFRNRQWWWRVPSSVRALEQFSTSSNILLDGARPCARSSASPRARAYGCRTRFRTAVRRRGATLPPVPRPGGGGGKGAPAHGKRQGRR